nr:MAG TPA: hypothetical protein [Caudoviricetes sp.]
MKTFFLILLTLAVLFAIVVVGVYLYSHCDDLGCLSRGCITDPEDCCPAHKFKPSKPKANETT